MKNFFLALSFALGFSATAHAVFGPITTCPGPYACILSSYLGLQFPDGSQQLTAASSGPGLSLGAFGSAPNANGASLSGGTLTLQPASTSFPGGITTGVQSFSGNKTFTNNLQVSGTTFLGGTNISSLTPSQAVVTDSSSNLISLSYTTAPTPSTLVSRDTFGSVSVATLGANILQLNGSVSNNVLLAAPASAGTGYTLQVPGGSGNAGDLLYNLGGGTTTWTPSTSANSPNTVMTRDSSGNTGVVNLTASQEVTGDIALITGSTGTATGALYLYGFTSGYVLVQPQDAAGSYNFNLPSTPGTAGQALLSGGGGSNPMTWGSAGRASTPPVRQLFNTPGNVNMTVPTPIPLYAHCLMVGGGGGSAGSGSSAGNGTNGGGTDFNSAQIQLIGGAAGGNNATASAGGNAVVNSGSLTISVLPWPGGGGSGVTAINPGSGTVLVSGGNGGASIFGAGAPGQGNGTAVSASNAGAGAGGGGPNTIGPGINASAGGGAGGGADVMITAGFTAGQNIPLIIAASGTAGSGGTGGWGGANAGPGQILCDWFY